MDTRVDEIAERIYRLATFVPGVGGPAGLTFTQFLIDADQPLLFHCGQRALFPSVAAAARRIIGLDRLRWITYSHAEADECGSLNDWLAAAPLAVPAHGAVGCAIWLRDQASRPPRVLGAAEALDLGGRRVRLLATPHLPHGWDAGLLFEETTGTLFCSDLFSQAGEGPPLDASDILGPAIAAEEASRFTSLTPATGPMIRRLAALAPRRLALMHGPTYTGDAALALAALAEYYEGRLQAGATD